MFMLKVEASVHNGCRLFLQNGDAQVPSVPHLCHGGHHVPVLLTPQASVLRPVLHGGEGEESQEASCSSGEIGDGGWVVRAGWFHLTRSLTHKGTLSDLC